MQRTIWLLFLLVLKRGNHTQQSDDNGVLYLSPTNNLQNANDEAIYQYRLNLQSALKEILSDLPDTRKKKIRQALQEALAGLTGLNLAITPLAVNIGNIKKQQTELNWQLKHQEEWKFWAAAKVQKVWESTDVLIVAEVVSITENLYNRYGLQLRNCVGDFLWVQIRFNQHLKEILSKLLSPTSELVHATEMCPSIKPKKCRKAVRNALNVLQDAPQNLHDLWTQSDKIKDSQKQCNLCLEKTLDDYAEERIELEKQLERIIDEYRESMTTVQY
ncbi:uncharacterized protein LOC128252311 [Drosophila gunungcola]|uniref:uncharacterized protein LOC128252311 n=1 Tax=Drosophila gunungcola TaxID=103775 RepID=UPI0022DFBEA1|nr:uncharacterized protein LOC128252311 [Drosophila gunungcola]